MKQLELERLIKTYKLELTIFEDDPDAITASNGKKPNDEDLDAIITKNAYQGMG